MQRIDLAGKVVLLTGSTGGFGRDLADALRARGARLALVDLAGSGVDDQAAHLGPREITAAWTADVRDLDSLTTAVNAAAGHFGALDVVVANAGVEAFESVRHGSPETFERVVDINLTGVWRTYRAALPHVLASRGHLLTVSSMAAFVHSPLQSSYVASKAGVWALSDSLRLELRGTGVTVGSVHPTFFDTPMMDVARADEGARLLWGEHRRPPWRFVPRERVVEETVTAIERRAALTTVPRRLGLVARAAGLARPVVELLGFPPRRTARAVEIAASRRA
ncbi:SDR family NAD(P)-dependent oxidoreductase [Mycolicibacterium obuense]|uniref:SDR family NAD(P)-dependent oxidoreductase n=1 Tax=Mycolicibacterium obuense TaxID=1807 RepID=A0A4V3AYP4_9MYCO|nr:SDR family NAD(P)-dependent oxidoreductase [Mycolicibacterium obuense]TDL07507.1 SDR family NAD(P)-dependent oxidoreductase [Mycolicibacterium obuense]